MNEIYIKIEGLNLFRIAQKLIDGGVMISNLKLKNTYILFSINEKYKQKLDEICKRERKKYYIVKNTKIKRFFAKMPYLLGTFLPFVILFVVFYVFHSTIFMVNITAKSEQNYDLSNIKNLLLENNIKVGQNRINLSPKEIEKIILENSSDIAGCEVFYEGRNLNIIIYPALIHEEIKNIDLLSKYNAIITKVDVFAGSSNVAVGDLVKEGDVLIKNNSGAQGEVFGKVYFSATQIYNENREVFVETGNVFETSSYSIASMIDIGGAKKCDFQNYKLEQNTHLVAKNLFIPIIKNDYIYREVKIEKKIIPFSEVEDEIKENLKSEALSKLPEGATAKNITYSVVSEGSYTRVDCYVETEIGLL